MAIFPHLSMDDSHLGYQKNFTIKTFSQHFRIVVKGNSGFFYTRIVD
jgi:hypothetical protein